jgi:glycosyltransferase involved in cell wall biosynthesis
MRVLIVSNYALPHVGGIQTLVDQEVRALAAEGHQIVLLTSDAGGLPATPAYPKQVRVIRVPAAHVLERRFQIFYPLFSPRLLPIVWREAGRCDVIHIHGLVFMTSLAATLSGRLRGKPCIVTEHLGHYHSESWVASLLARWLMETGGRLTARLADRLIGFTPPIVTLLAQLTGSPSRSTFMAKPVDLSWFQPPTPAERQAARDRLGWEQSRPKALFVGRLIPDKGVQVLLHAADPRYDLVFCGPGDHSILEQALGPGISYFPPRHPLQLRELYQAADVVVAPSIREGGLPLVALEALACGRPVVLANYDGAGLYRDMAGIVICDRKPEAIRSAILECLREPGRWDTAEIVRGLARIVISPQEWVRSMYEPFAPPCRNRAG